MITRAQKVRLGVFVVVSVAILVGTLAVLAGLRAIEKRDRYTVRFDGSVSGLEEGAQVEYNGVRVGRVGDIRIDREDVSQVVVTLSLEADTPIKEDTRAELKASGITGLKTIELMGGSEQADFVEPGGTIPSGVSTLDRLTGKAEAIGAKAELALNRLNKLLNAQNRERIGGILENTEAITASVAAIAEENRAPIRDLARRMADLAAQSEATLLQLEQRSVATLDAVRVAAEDLQGVVDKDKVDRILTRVDGLAGEVQAAVDALDVKRISEDLRGMIDRAERLVANLDVTVVKSREDIFASLDLLVAGLEDFSDFTRMVRENPALLLKGPQEAERER
ncbi:MAG: MlaD family protein [Myxococcota bacterium]